MPIPGCGSSALASNGRDDREISADMGAVTATEFATVLGDESGPLVSTAEHVLAALSGLGVDNALVEIDGPEAPIMDGSAAPFVAAIDQVGLETLDEPRRYIQVLKPVRVAKDDAYGEFRPNPRGFRVEAEIEFDHPLIGRQAFALDVEPDTFPPRARTRPHLRVHARRGEAVERRLRARRLAREYPRRHRQSRSQPGRPALPGRIRAPQGRSTRSATWRLPADPCSAPIGRCAAATSSITPCCRR